MKWIIRVTDLIDRLGRAPKMPGPGPTGIRVSKRGPDPSREEESREAHGLSDTACMLDFTLFDEAFEALTSRAMLETFRKGTYE